MRNVTFGALEVGQIPEGVNVQEVPLRVVLGAVSDGKADFSTSIGNGYVTKIDLDNRGIHISGLVAVSSDQVISDTQLAIGISDNPSDHIIYTVKANQKVDIPATSDGYSFFFRANERHTRSSLAGVINSKSFYNGVVNSLTSGSDPSVDTYTVTLPTDDHATIAAQSGSESPVEKGGSFSFTVTPAEGYHITSVKANDVTLTASEGVYTISNINENQIVTVVIEQD